MRIHRLTATAEALKVIEMLKKEYGELVFNQSGGCCDGTAPMCYEKKIFTFPLAMLKWEKLQAVSFSLILSSLNTSATHKSFSTLKKKKPLLVTRFHWKSMRAISSSRARAFSAMKKTAF